MPTWLLLLLGVASRQEQPYHKGNDRPAPWRCDEPRSRARTDLCFPLDDSLRDDGSEDVRLYNMEPEPVKTNRSCCGLPPVKCPANTEYPLTCLLDKVSFATKHQTDLDLEWIPVCDLGFSCDRGCEA